MQETDQKELKKLIHDDTMDMDTIADLEKMISRKKIEKLHRYTIFYNDKRDAYDYLYNPLTASESLLIMERAFTSLSQQVTTTF